MTDTQPGNLIVTHNRRFDTVEINYIYISDYADMLYLFDPENPPADLDQHSGKTLSLDRADAERLRDRLIDILK